MARNATKELLKHLWARTEHEKRCTVTSEETLIDFGELWENEEWLEIMQRACLGENAIQKLQELEHSKIYTEEQELDAQRKQMNREHEAPMRKQQRHVVKEESEQRHREKTAEKEARSKMEWKISGHIEVVHRAEAEARKTRRRPERKRTYKKTQNEAEQNIKRTQ